MQVIYHVFLPIVTRVFDGFSADGDSVIDGLPDGSTDESNYVQMAGNLPGFQTFGNFHTVIHVGIFTMNSADGWMDRTDDKHTDRQTDCMA